MEEPPKHDLPPQPLTTPPPLEQRDPPESKQDPLKQDSTPLQQYSRPLQVDSGAEARRTGESNQAVSLACPFLVSVHVLIFAAGG